MATQKCPRNSDNDAPAMPLAQSLAASAAEDERIEFMDLASHELRSPLTALSGTAQLLQRRLRDDPQRAADAADLDKILYHTARLANQVDVFLAASHLARQRFEVLLAECDAIAVMRRVVRVFAAASRGRAMTFTTDADELLIAADRKRLDELLTILLTNAIKFSSRGDIGVRVEHAPETMRVEVADHGIGVLAAERQRIFEPYVRGSNTATNSPGLGLYVARAIVERHGGNIGVRPNQGGGSVFWVELPRHTAAAGTDVDTGTTGL